MSTELTQAELPDWDPEYMPKLLKTLDPFTYQTVMNALRGMRAKYPSYRDDQLLIYMVCELQMKLNMVVSLKGIKA